MINNFLKKILPPAAIESLRRIRQQYYKVRSRSLPPLTEKTVKEILTDTLGLRTGDVVFVHSSIDRLNLDFPFYRMLAMLREIVGESGTLLFPTDSSVSSPEFLLSGKVFDIKKTPSTTGLLTEFARRQTDALRSLHPTKSVCAIGPAAAELTADHHKSPYPYDSTSPYYKITQYNGKIIGLGVTTRNLTFVHCVDDAMKDAFPVEPYHQEPFKAECVDYHGNAVTVSTHAHDRRKMRFDIPRFMRKQIPPDICRDLKLQGMSFFLAQSRPLFEHMVDLAKRNITIYQRKFYRQ